jgi:dipeptidyl aminopeptidase/acylaminoacyl peptidase
MAFAFVPGRDVLVWAARRAPYGSPVPYRLYGAAVGGAPEAWSDDGVGVSPPLILCDWRWPTSRVPFVVAPDGLSVVALVQEGGSVVARRFHRDGRSELALGGPGATVTDLDVDGASRRVAFVRATHTTIDDVFVADPDGRERRLTDAAALWPDAGAVIAPEPFTLTTTDGLSVDCMWLGPPDAAGPVPTVLAVHGGPHGAWGDNLHLEHQLLARRGIGVLWVNPRGSSGYGPAFAERVLGRWGEEDLADLMAAVDRVVADGRADPERLAIMGTSYGGFMAAWAIGLSRRFRTAVVQAPVTDLISMYGTSDIGSSFLPYELGGLDPWRDVGAMWERSPLSHVDAVTASVLLICGEHDDRCPIGQSEEYFTALRERGREVVFLRYPGESHLLAWTGTPGHRIHRQQAVVDWLAAHLHDGPARGATGPEAADGHGG